MSASVVAPLIIAIVIGQNAPDPSSGAETLRYADDDAVEMATLLRDAGAQVSLLTRLDADTAQRRGAPPALDEVRIAGAPTVRDLMRVVGEQRVSIAAARASSQRVELIVAFSGHGGVARGQGYLVLEDARLTRDQLFRDVIAPLDADDTHVIVDACRSYFLLPRGGTVHDGDVGVRSPAPRAIAGDIDGRRIGFVLSTSSDRASHEYDPLQSGVFSYEVRSALRGAADADGDGVVTYAELAAFLERANAALKNPLYRPDFFVRPPSSNRDAIVRWPTPPTVVLDTVDGAALGHVVVWDDALTRIADVNPAPGFNAALHLPHARPLFVGTDSDARIIGADAGDDALAYTSLATAPALETVRARGPDLAAFALRSLFEAPFSLHDVDDARPLPALPDDPPDPYFAASIASGGVAVGAGAVAVGATVWAQQIRDAGLLSRSNADRAQRNVAIGVLDWTTGIATGVGGAGAVVAASALFLRASE